MPILERCGHARDEVLDGPAHRDVELAHAPCATVTVAVEMRLGRLAPAFVHRRQWAHRIAAARPGDDGTSTFWRELLVERAGRLAKRDAIAWGACYASLLARGELRHAGFEPLRGRVLIVESPDDPVIAAVERSALRAFHTGAEVAAPEGAGHLAPERRPAELAAVIEAFVRIR